MEQINDHLIDRLQTRIPSDALWHGHHARLIDGTGLSMPDTKANQARWPQSKSQKPGCGFPSMNLVGIFCLHTGSLLKSATGDRHCHETRLFQSIWSALKPGDLAVADRGFCSYAAVAGLLTRKVSCLMRLPENKMRKAIGSQLPKTANFDVIVPWKRPAKCPRTMTPPSLTSCPKASWCAWSAMTSPNVAFALRA